MTTPILLVIKKLTNLMSKKYYKKTQSQLLNTFLHYFKN